MNDPLGFLHDDLVFKRSFFRLTILVVFGVALCLIIAHAIIGKAPIKDSAVVLFDVGKWLFLAAAGKSVLGRAAHSLQPKPDAKVSAPQIAPPVDSKGP